MSKVVYWAPFIKDDSTNWNLLYNDLESLHDETRKQLSKNVDKATNFMYCPAFSDIAKNTYVIKNPIRTDLEVTNQEVIPKSRNAILTEIKHGPTLENNPLIVYGLRYIFFSEHSVNLTLTSPYFSDSPHLRYGMLVPGKLDISKWFRVIHLEYNIWKPGNVTFNKDEVMAYINFDQDVTLKRFEMNEKLYSIANAVATSSDWESFVPLIDRYKRFTQSRTNKIVLKEIQKNVY